MPYLYMVRGSALVAHRIVLRINLTKPLEKDSQNVPQDSNKESRLGLRAMDLAARVVQEWERTGSPEPAATLYSIR